MSDVYVVMTSNCEEYEDYHESIDSVWSTRELAISHIEDEMKMRQISQHDPDVEWSMDRWIIEFPEFPNEKVIFSMTLKDGEIVMMKMEI